MMITELALKALTSADVGTRLREPGNLVGNVRLNRAQKLIVAFEYRFRWEGKTKSVSVGTWPTVKLATVRRNRDDYRAQVSRGVNPIQERIQTKLSAKADLAERQAEQRARLLAAKQSNARLTVEELFERWAKLALEPSRADGGAEVRRMFTKDVLPSIGSFAVDDVTRGDIAQLLDSIRARGVSRTVGLTLSLIRQMFRFAISRDWIESDPTAALKQSDFGIQTVERERVLSQDEIGELAQRLGPARLNITTEVAIWMMLATGCRVGEISRARWSDIDFKNGVWTIPAEHAKNSREHSIYLSEFALTQLARLRQTQTHVQWVIPARDVDANGHWPHISTSSITKQVRDRQRKSQIRQRAKASDALILSGGTWTPHDLRRTAATLMGDLGVEPVVIERCLNHVEPDRLRRIYQRQKYIEQQRKAWALLGERLALLSSNNPNVAVLNLNTA